MECEQKANKLVLTKAETCGKIEVRRHSMSKASEYFERLYGASSIFDVLDPMNMIIFFCTPTLHSRLSKDDDERLHSLFYSFYEDPSLDLTSAITISLYNKLLFFKSRRLHLESEIEEDQKAIDQAIKYLEDSMAFQRDIVRALQTQESMEDFFTMHLPKQMDVINSYYNVNYHYYEEDDAYYDLVDQCRKEFTEFFKENPEFAQKFYYKFLNDYCTGIETRANEMIAQIKERRIK